jgi:hypothetical protein
MELTPKEKAKELIDRYLDIENYNNLNLDLFCDECGMSVESSKYCALIAVDEIIDQWQYIDTYISDLGGKLNLNLYYWQQVKQEINNL